MSINYDPSEFAQANLELEYTKFGSIEALASFFLIHVANLDPINPQEQDTAKRFVRSLRDMTTPKPFDFTTFPAEDDEMITELNIPFTSLCRHHVIPFYGKAHVAYIPGKDIAGLSKIARTVQYCATKLQTQEQLTTEVSEFLSKKLDPVGVAVILEAEHMCMAIRGVKAPGVVTVTSRMSGVFADHNRTAKAEFMSLIRR